LVDADVGNDDGNADGGDGVGPDGAVRAVELDGAAVVFAVCVDSCVLFGWE